MYNNIGLQTPRGSGTSGYITSNFARVRPVKSRLEFLKELKSIRENQLPPPRKANKDILEHKKKREIYVKIEEMREELNKSGDKTPEEIAQILKETEEKMLSQYSEGKLDIDLDKKKDTHTLAALKEKEQRKIKNAFDIKENYEIGSAFDFALQEKERLTKKYERELAKVEKIKKLKEEQKEEKKRIKAEKKARKQKKKEEKRLKKKLEDEKEKVTKVDPKEDGEIDPKKTSSRKRLDKSGGKILYETLLDKDSTSPKRRRGHKKRSQKSRSRSRENRNRKRKTKRSRRRKSSSLSSSSD